jgi:hypothetical protein
MEEAASDPPLPEYWLTGIPWSQLFQERIELLSWAGILITVYCTLCAHRVLPAPRFLGVHGLPDEDNLTLFKFCIAGLIVLYLGPLLAARDGASLLKYFKTGTLEEVLQVRLRNGWLCLLMGLIAYLVLLGVIQHLGGIDFHRRWP